jgi:hypothetical protein
MNSRTCLAVAAIFLCLAAWKMVGVSLAIAVAVVGAILVVIEAISSELGEAERDTSEDCRASCRQNETHHG